MLIFRKLVIEGLKQTRLLSSSAHRNAVWLLNIDYPIRPKRRWTESSPHPHLMEQLAAHKGKYRDIMRRFCAFAESFSEIPFAADPADSKIPSWDNGYFPPLDAISLYGFIASEKPRVYLEIGSGNSTKFARRAVTDHGLATRIISVDPEPRAEIDLICDELIRTPFEDLDVSALISRLSPGDIIFFDGSHRCFQNSDVTTFFMELLPEIPAGVLVGIHDIFLPCDYPETWLQRHYSEQYLLAAWLMADRSVKFEIEFPCYFLEFTGQGADDLSPVWEKLPPGTGKNGGAFWMRAR